MLWHIAIFSCGEWQNVPVVSLARSVYRIMLVHHIDSVSFEGKLDVYCASTVVGRQHNRSLLLNLRLPIVAIRGLPFPRVAFTVPILEAVLANIFEPGTVTAFFVLCRALGVLEAISVLNSFDNRSRLPK